MQVPYYGYPIVYILASIGFVISLVGLPTVLLARGKSKVASSRSPFLLICLCLALNMQRIVMLMNFVVQPEMYCYIELIFWKIVIPQSSVILAFMGVRQLMQYWISKRNYEILLATNDQTENNQLENTVHKDVESQQTIPETKSLWQKFISLFPQLEDQIKDKYIMKVYAIVWTFIVSLPLISVLRTGIYGDPYDSTSCEDNIVEGWNYISGTAAVVIFVALPISLRKARDAYYLIREIQLIALFGILGLFAFLLTFNPTTEWIGYLLTIVITDIIDGVCFGYIGYRSWKEIYDKIHDDVTPTPKSLRKTSASDKDESMSSVNGNDDESTNSVSDNTDVTTKHRTLHKSESIHVELPIFKDQPFFYNMLVSKKGLEAIGNYTGFIQETDFYYPMFYFFHDYIAFVKLDPLLFDAHTCFIFQKYFDMEKGARTPIWLPFDIQAFYNSVYEKIKDDTKHKEISIDIKILDKAKEYIENVVKETFIPEFLRSEQYKEYKRNTN